MIHVSKKTPIFAYERMFFRKKASPTKAKSFLMTTLAKLNLRKSVHRKLLNLKLSLFWHTLYLRKALKIQKNQNIDVSEKLGQAIFAENPGQKIWGKVKRSSNIGQV